MNSSSGEFPPFGVEQTTDSAARSDERELFGRYASIIRYLRSPVGCPWDRKQTLRSMRTYVLEEAFELVAAIDETLEHEQDAAIESGETPAADVRFEEIGDELGDLFLVGLLVSDCLEAAGGPSLAAVLNDSGHKLVRRHPHVFGDVQAHTPDEVVTSWNDIKERVEGRSSDTDSVSGALPPLFRALEIQKKAARKGFDWPAGDARPILDKIVEEAEELAAEIENSNPQRREQELGDLLFSVVNLARHLKVDPSLALAGANKRFLRRFAHVKRKCAELGVEMEQLELAELDRYWIEAKELEF